MKPETTRSAASNLALAAERGGLDNTVDIPALIRSLDTDNIHEQRRVSRQLMEAGAIAIPALIQALESGTPHMRKGAAYLLGTHRDCAPVVAALGKAVEENLEPKVRQNAAVSLGRIGQIGAAIPLANALERETIPWVRRSMILALGAIGGDVAVVALRGANTSDASECEALRKALDRCAPERHDTRWHDPGALHLRLLLQAPVGLESATIAEAACYGLPPIALTKPGLLHCPPGAAPWDWLPALRCAYGLVIDAGRGPRINFEAPDAEPAIAALLSRSQELREWRRWLETGDSVARYRFGVEGVPLRRDALRQALASVRASCEPLGLVDSPSNYDIELIVKCEAASSQLYIKPSFMKDPRFSYRRGDVGAAIHPVVAACLARSARQSDSATVFDPVCGSGTLLIERARLDPGVRAVGIDISPTAIHASRANVEAADLAGQVQVSKGDARSTSCWPECDEVIANLPFGLRTRREEMDLPQLYHTLLAHLSTHLRPGGRAVLYTANQSALERGLAGIGNLRVIDRMRVLSGGVWVGVWILEARQRANQTPHTNASARG